MADPRPDVLAFLRTRRSYPPGILTRPGPSEAELTDLLTMAARVPDHGKLEPWRFIIIRGPAAEQLATEIEAASTQLGHPPEKARKHGDAFRVPVVVGVVSAPVAHPSIPEWEQFLSAGAVCLELVNAALAAGFGASWLSGVASGAAFAPRLGLSDGERMAGFVHIGSRTDTTPSDRPRPDISAKVTMLA